MCAQQPGWRQARATRRSPRGTSEVATAHALLLGRRASVALRGASHRKGEAGDSGPRPRIVRSLQTPNERKVTQMRTSTASRRVARRVVDFAKWAVPLTCLAGCGDAPRSEPE